MNSDQTSARSVPVNKTSAMSVPVNKTSAMSVSDNKAISKKDQKRSKRGQDWPKITSHYGRWTDHPGLIYYVFDFDRKFHPMWKFASNKRHQQIRRAYLQAYRQLPELQPVIKAWLGHKKHLSGERKEAMIEYLMTEIDMYLHGWRSKDTLPYQFFLYGLAFFKYVDDKEQKHAQPITDVSLAVCRGIQYDARADYGLEQNKTMPPRSRCVQLQFYDKNLSDKYNEAEKEEKDLTKRTSLNSWKFVQATLPGRLWKAAKRLWFAKVHFFSCLLQ